MSTSKTTRRTVLASAGLIAVALMLWTYCGPVNLDSQPVAEQARPPIEAVPLAEELAELAPIAPFAGEPAEELAAALMVPATARVVAAEPAPVGAAPPAAPVEVARSLDVPRPAVTTRPPEPVPEQDLLIADSASSRFTPNVASDAVDGFDLGASIQGDENALNVLQPCDTAASGCMAGLAQGQVIGRTNDWCGFVLPGF